MDSRASFVVRVVHGGQGEVRGVIERVATGAKEAFTGIEAISQVIAEMLRAEVRGDAGLAHGGGAAVLRARAPRPPERGAGARTPK